MGESALVIDKNLSIALKSSTRYTFVSKAFVVCQNIIEGGTKNG